MNNKNKKFMINVMYILFGTFIMSLGYFFFNIPAQIASGGVTGFSQVIKHIFPVINIGLLVGLLNIVLLIVGNIFIGREFGFWTLMGSIFFSGWLTLLDAFLTIEQPILKDNIANLIIGASLAGLGLSIVFRRNASTGGSDVIAKIIQKHTSYSISQSILLVDTLIIIFATSVFGLESGIYSFLSLYVTTYVLDASIEGFNKKIQMSIISDKIEEINNYIQNEIGRGTTLYEAKGGYKGERRVILQTIVDNKQYVRIRNYVKRIDDTAFVYLTNINEVIGYGFSRELEHVPTGENTKLGD